MYLIEKNFTKSSIFFCRICNTKFLKVLEFRSYQVFHYTRCNMPKRATILRGPIPSGITLRPGSTALEEMLKRWRAVGNTVSNFTGLRFELQTSRFRDERVTARATSRWALFYYFWICDIQMIAFSSQRTLSF